jgi:hypothetical protein
VLATQETFCIVIARLLERDSFDLLLPEFDKPWVIHLRETCATLQTSALGGPTLSTRIEACIDISPRIKRTKKESDREANTNSGRNLSKQNS